MKHLIIFTALSVFLSCSNNKTEIESQETPPINSETVELTPAQEKLIHITTDTLVQGFIAQPLKLNGKIDVPPQNLFSVSAPLGGYLSSTKLLPGMRIQKGEVIAVLEDQQYIQIQQDYLTTQAQLQVAEAEFLRQKELNQSKASSDKVLQQSQSQYNTLSIALAALQEKLKLLHINPKTLSAQNLSRQIKIYAPFNGFVTSVNVNIGKYINPSEVLFELVDPSDIHLNLHVFEKDITHLQIGQTLIAYTNAQPGVKYNCEIIAISNNISSDHIAEVHCHFSKYDKTLLPGMYMNAELNLQSKNTHLVPQSAVLTYEGKKYLFVHTQKSTYQLKELKPGTSNNQHTEVLNAQEFINSKIVVQDAYALLMTLKNKPEE